MIPAILSADTVQYSNCFYSFFLYWVKLGPIQFPEPAHHAIKQEHVLKYKRVGWYSQEQEERRGIKFI